MDNFCYTETKDTNHFVRPLQIVAIVNSCIFCIPEFLAIILSLHDYIFTQAARFYWMGVAAEESGDMNDGMYRSRSPIPL